MSFTARPEFSAVGAVLVAALVLLVLIGALRSYRLLRALREPAPRLRLYLASVISAWLLAAVGLIAFLASPGVSAADVGLVTDPSTTGQSVTLIGVLALALGGVRGLQAIRRRGQPPQPLPPGSRVGLLIPRTAAERWAAAGVAVTAGVTEEFIHRGLMIAAGVGILGLPTLAAAALALALFTFGHLYQGPLAVVPMLLGALLTAVYLMSGSLLPGILLHVLIDLIGLPFARRVAAPAPPPPAPPPPAGPAPTDPTPTAAG